MVRRLKSDLRAIGEKFPKRIVGRIEIDRLPADAPELVLSQLLQQYRRAREARLATASKSQQASAMLVVTSLQKRLLSSIEAFARTLDVHRASMLATATKTPTVEPRTLDLLATTPDADDELAELPEEDVEKEEDAQMVAATRQSQSEPAALLSERNIAWFTERAASTLRFSRGFQIAQLFNHQTHYRSQVTAALDAMGIDYGSTDMPRIPYLADAPGTNDTGGTPSLSP
jgi:uncharacterized damage-inducible protein DinB